MSGLGYAIRFLWAHRAFTAATVLAIGEWIDFFLEGVATPATGASRQGSG